jgi:hypothetical protein
MSLPFDFTKKRIVAVDSQKLDAIQSCMYMYKLRFGSGLAETTGLQPLQTPDYFERGGLLHDMLETYYKLKKYKSRWHQNGKTHADIMESCIIVGRTKATKMSLDIAEIEIVIDAFRQYTSHWENDGWYMIEAVEQVGSRVLYDSPELIILYESKIDLILNINGVMTPVDHKSAKSRRDPNYLANQFKGYCWTLGVNNLIVNEIGFQKTIKPVEKFRRHTLSYSASALKEWQENTVWWIMYAIGLIEKENFPKNYTSCDKYSGCLFKSVCAADPEVRDYKIASLFEEKHWDVGLENL